MDSNRVLLEIKTSRTGEETPESMVQFLSSLSSLRKQVFYFLRFGIPISLEIYVEKQLIHFYITVPDELKTFLESQLTSQYPKVMLTQSKDYLPTLFKDKERVALGQLKLRSNFMYPLRSFKDFKEVDPMSSFLGVLSKVQPEDLVALQVLLLPVSNSWQEKGEAAMRNKTKGIDGTEHSNPYAKVISEKIALHGFKTAIRIAVAGEHLTRSKHLLGEIANSFSSFNNPSGNSLYLSRPVMWQKERLINAMTKRGKFFMPQHQILNVEEIATFFHFPTSKLSNIKNVSWYKTILSDPPENLPIAEGLTEDEKKEINFFAKTEFRNKQSIFGIKEGDRRKHMYIIGKTGTGKSTLIANMAISDIRNGKGMAIIDPHGDLCETILNYIPTYRINDVVYLDPSDPDYAFSLNPLEVENPLQKELVVSGIVAIFHKLYAQSWGPRLEYILRNAILTVIELPNPTMLMIPEILTNDSFRHEALKKIHDPVLKSYWINEFEQMPPKLKAESMSPILNKVGQFISSQTIRNIVKSPKSTINLERIMNEGKILIFNLSQGRIGEDNAALLGAMTITKLQLAAMNRVNMKEADRRDFYLYVDEFQNFATTSFIKILSEARKYRLNLILANQYIAQVPEDVRAAIFGNAGTLMSFLVGAQDSSYLAKEFTERFKEEDLLALGNFQSILKLSIDSKTEAPFLCYTLPLPKSITQTREKVIANSRQRYTKKVEKQNTHDKKEETEKPIHGVVMDSSEEE